ncbi:MAG: hypothetical protein ACK56I_31980, partial [bacterium]
MGRSAALARPETMGDRVWGLGLEAVQCWEQPDLLALCAPPAAPAPAPPADPLTPASPAVTVEA